MLSGNCAEMKTSTPFRDLSHAANLRHGTDGFTSPPKEGVLRIFFSSLKIRRLRPGLNPVEVNIYDSKNNKREYPKKKN